VNAFRPFAVGRKGGLFADSSRRASARCYSLIGSVTLNPEKTEAIKKYNQQSAA